MRPTPWLLAESFRFQVPTNSPYASSYGEPFGAFIIKYKPAKHKSTTVLRCIVASGETAQQDMGINHAWDHVSVSLKNRCPTWNEMTYVKDLFFLPEETVFQFHPPQSEYVNLHPYTLHLWRPLLVTVPLPPKEMVG